MDSSRRAVLGGAVAAFLTLGSGTAAATTAKTTRHKRVLIATNEPWGTYHVKPLLTEAARLGVHITQLVPDYSQVKPGDPVPVTALADAPRADLLVVNGAEAWPADCARHFRRLPVIASSLAYLQPVEAPRAKEFRHRLRLLTASSPAEARSFRKYFGTQRNIRVVGSPQTDNLPTRAPEKDRVLVITSVTRPDGTGNSAPGTELLLAAAGNLAAAGKRILVGLHPRENRELWERYEISDVPTLQASARAEAAIGIPGTVFPFVAAVGTPLVGCTDPKLTVPGYLRAVCSSTIDDAALAVSAVDHAHLPDEAVLEDSVGPIGGSARRLLRSWAC
ncbi:hypothetical protein [Kibdelosporangium phytohabitans]|uniref:Uncharacterized protein n=1 Tax=Kibdelosporangium phytohabitans TaxID=860235 RepID=A0A0N9I0C3_9PSEU|nr:hypothetical protein [Kibdelosporangium phytohabitans]ALG13125.1 hypothetical protein AOZ06_45300 [Kibdelosporangium phytohabitans]MBE1464869.1 hypothetical protein [Kibdelosporangium phytohabitans]